MTLKRYHFLNDNPGVPLTKAEVKQGWHRCWTAWDGLLIHRNDAEAWACRCQPTNQPKDTHEPQP